MLNTSLNILHKISQHNKWTFPLRISCGLVTFTEEILNAKLYFFCSACTKLSIKKKRRRPLKVWGLIFFIFFFFYQGFLSRTLTTHRTAGQGRDHLIPLYHFHPLTNIQTFICNFAREMTITYF